MLHLQLVVQNPNERVRDRVFDGALIVGETWSAPLYNRDLPSPVENGDMILGARTATSLGIGQPLLLTHPNSEFDRANGSEGCHFLVVWAFLC